MKDKTGKYITRHWKFYLHEEIVAASKRIAKQIEEDYKDKEPVLLMPS